MTTLEVSLASALAAALVAIVVLARCALAQRRLVRQGRWAEAKATAGAAGERAAREQLAADIMARLTAELVMPLREILGEHAAAIARAKAEANSAHTALGQRIGDVGEQARDLQVIVRQLREATIPLDAPPSTRVASTRLYPSIPPPVSAEVRSPEPAQIAAGIGPRPASRPLSAGATPHPRPVRTTGKSPAILPPAVLPARSTTGDDADTWDQEQRPSDAEGERTQVGPRPSPEELGLPPRPAAPTLVSMKAVTTSDGTGGGS